MAKLEYRVEVIQGSLTNKRTAKKIETMLNERAGEGWRVVDITQHGLTDCTVVFEREIQ